MMIDITRLKSGMDEYIEINESVTMEQMNGESKELLDLKDTVIKGKLFRNFEGKIALDSILEGTMVLPCAITLKSVDYSFSVAIVGNIEDLYQEIDKNLKNRENSIDILPIIWENILMEMPMKVVSKDLSDAKMIGDGWKLITEEKKSYVNPEFEKLKDLLK